MPSSIVVDSRVPKARHRMIFIVWPPASDAQNFSVIESGAELQLHLSAGATVPPAVSRIVARAESPTSWLMLPVPLRRDRFTTDVGPDDSGSKPGVEGCACLL